MWNPDCFNDGESYGYRTLQAAARLTGAGTHSVLRREDCPDARAVVRHWPTEESAVGRVQGSGGPASNSIVDRPQRDWGEYGVGRREMVSDDVANVKRPGHDCVGPAARPRPLVAQASRPRPESRTSREAFRCPLSGATGGLQRHGGPRTSVFPEGGSHEGRRATGGRWAFPQSRSSMLLRPWMSEKPCHALSGFATTHTLGKARLPLTYGAASGNLSTPLGPRSSRTSRGRGHLGPPNLQIPGRVTSGRPPPPIFSFCQVVRRPVPSASVLSRVPAGGSAGSRTPPGLFATGGTRRCWGRCAARIMNLCI